jgi:hypothetical protein
MRIFVQPRSGDSFDLTIRNAVEILQTANILSARAGGTMNERAEVLIDSEEVLRAIAMLLLALPSDSRSLRLELTLVALKRPGLGRTRNNLPTPHCSHQTARAFTD